jgi:hypothetical protein
MGQKIVVSHVMRANAFAEIRVTILMAKPTKKPMA